MINIALKVAQSMNCGERAKSTLLGDFTMSVDEVFGAR